MDEDPVVIQLTFPPGPPRSVADVLGEYPEVDRLRRMRSRPGHPERPWTLQRCVRCGGVLGRIAITRYEDGLLSPLKLSALGKAARVFREEHEGRVYVRVRHRRCQRDEKIPLEDYTPGWI